MWQKLAVTLMMFILPTSHLILSLQSAPPSLASVIYCSIVLPQIHMHSMRFPLNPFTKNKTTFAKSNLYKRLVRLKMSLNDASGSFSADLKEIIDKGPIDINDRVFVINGWRWHTLSVMRDLDRFLAIVRSIQRQKKDQLQKKSSFAAFVDTSSDIKGSSNDSVVTSTEERVLGCYNYLCGFNWKGLIRVESKIFFPWLSKLLPDSATLLMEDIVNEQLSVLRLSRKMEVEIMSLSKGGATLSDDIRRYEQIEALIVEMRLCASKIQRIQNGIFVPYISAFVKKGDQEVFNRRVITTLGLIDSQVHLVGMFDAIKDLPAEVRLYERQIPRMARALIPMWRSRLYKPRARYLELDCGESDSSCGESIEKTAKA